MESQSGSETTQPSTVIKNPETIIKSISENPTIK